MTKIKIVVFDMDETLGYFIEFGIFWDSLNLYIKNKKSVKLIDLDFMNILDIYPEFIRPNIFSILNYLKYKKLSKECQGVMIYTNNQGPKEWVYMIKNYFEKKINYKLFDNIITAFKVNGQHYELCRTTHNKTFKDFIRCTKLPENTEICFLDDIYHPEMNNNNVYYIKVKPYTHDLPFDEMIQRFINNDISKNIINDKKEFTNFMKENMNKYSYTYTGKDKEEYEIDKIVTKKTMLHLHLFFGNNKEMFFHKKSQKNKVYKSKTKKNR